MLNRCVKTTVTWHKHRQTESLLLYELLHTSTLAPQRLPRFGFGAPPLTAWLLPWTWEHRGKRVSLAVGHLADIWTYVKWRVTLSHHSFWTDFIGVSKSVQRVQSPSVLCACHPLSVSLRASGGLLDLKVLSFKVVLTLCDLWWKQS